MAHVDTVQDPKNASDAKAGALSHPRGLYILFFTEMWERFSYYGMRALLVPYMLGYLMFQPAASSGTYKWYTSLVYLTPLLGGLLADRFLGLRASIVIGGVLMAVGHFLMAFEPLPFFYTALAFLIAGNGFFKPNISTLVGKLYVQGDPRRDGAFTIFYMGINLGAFLAPLVCGWLRQHYGPHYGFAAAGVGMVIGLFVFLLGQRRVLADVAAAGNALKSGKDKVAEEHAHDPDEDEPAVPGGAGVIAKVFPVLIVLLGVAIAGYYGLLVVKKEESPTALIMPIGFLAVFAAISVMLVRIKGASRDKSTVIFVLFCAAVLFWMAFEQAGNTLNIWAVAHTDLHIGSFEYPAEWFQSVNALLIFVLGLPFAAMWVRLAKKGREPSTPSKMTIGLALVAVSFVPMVIGAAAENATEATVHLEALPAGIDLGSLDAGRMAYDPSSRELRVRGVLPPYAVNDALSRTVDAQSLARIDALDPSKRAAALAEAAPAEFRASLVELANKSERARVGAIWLLLSYFIATLGELCLSPVGLSMVTKLAPARFASLFMGVWLLASSVAQYAGGTLGEKWGKMTPKSYFELFVWICAIGAAALLFLIKPLRRLMHDVH